MATKNKEEKPQNFYLFDFEPTEQAEWYGNWLQNRKDILNNNIQVAKKNISPEEEIENQLNNAAKYSYYYKPSWNIIEPDGTTFPQGVVEVRPTIEHTNSSKLHEYTHAATRGYKTWIPAPQLKAMSGYKMRIHSNFANNTKYKQHFDEYLSTPDEIYARMMQFRKENNLDPQKKYTVDEIKELIKYSNVPEIFLYDPEDFTRLLNEIAQTDTNVERLPMAKQGLKVNYLNLF